MKTLKLSPEHLKIRQRRKKLLLWQGEQLKRFKPFILVKSNRG